MPTLSDRMLTCFAIQANDNTVVGVEAASFVRNLLLFDECIMATIRFQDLQFLLRYVEIAPLIELIESGALSFYYDSATAAEIGSSRHQLALSGNTARLQSNEFHFCIVKGHDDDEISKALNRLEANSELDRSQRSRLVQAIASRLHSQAGMSIHQASFNDFYTDIRSGNTDILRQLIAEKLAHLGLKPKGLSLEIEEFVHEDFRVRSNLMTRFGLNEAKTRSLCSRMFFDLLGIYIRTHHMRELNCLMGMSDQEEKPWKLKVDKLIAHAAVDQTAENNFLRVLSLAGGNGEQGSFTKIDLDRLIKVRASDDVILFRNWIRDSREKTNKEIVDRTRSFGSIIGNSLQTSLGKSIRFIICTALGQFQSPAAQAVSLGVSAADTFLLERIFAPDPIVGVISRDYPAIFK